MITQAGNGAIAYYRSRERAEDSQWATGPGPKGVDLPVHLWRTPETFGPRKF